MPAAGPRLRLLTAGEEDAGSATCYLELDAATLESDRAALLGLLSPEYLVDGGLSALLDDARDHGQTAPTQASSTRSQAASTR